MKLYRFEYSCYARKAQMVLDLLGLRYDIVEVPFGDRTELATLTHGYIQVPVLVDDRGEVIVDSRAICETLLQGEYAERLVPSPWQGPIWAYADWCDGPLEDVLFRIASPGIRRWLTRTADRALLTFIKERKFGKGCVDDWERGAADLIARARALLAPTAQTLRQQPFIFGPRATLADAALYGLCAMLRGADATMPGALAPELAPWMSRVEDARPAK
ncbi:MAG: glutathione S-transferase family protein [Deltaproteobacteria bacterium]|nr:glutathione S-transferase family protein [Deltaproteobacteria bacterium]MBI3388241.1 glutathione S-transferase family protein [Deltaproteobacteria bacterium]